MVPTFKPTRQHSSSNLNESWRRYTRNIYVLDFATHRQYSSQINAFYLQKEAELKLRLETLLSKRRAAASRVLPDAADGTPKDHVEWKAVEEGFRLLERDLRKLQVSRRSREAPRR